LLTHSSLLSRPLLRSNPCSSRAARRSDRAANRERVERVEITGSRLPQVNVEGPSPVTTLNAQDIKFDGHAKAEDC